MRGLACLLVGVAACGCAPSRSPGTPPPRARSPIERFFPLVDGTIYTYQLQGGDAFMIRVKRTGPTTAQLITGDSIKPLTISPASVRREQGGILLQTPLEPGVSWQGVHGTVSVVDIHAEVKVPAGAFRDCVLTREDVGGDAHGRIETWFCPEVGIARMSVQEWHGAQSVSQLTELRSFGPPVDLQK